MPTVRPWLLALAAAACTPSSPPPEDASAARAAAPSPTPTTFASPRTTQVCVVRDAWGAWVHEHSHQGLILSVRPLDPAAGGARTWTYDRDGMGRIDGIEVDPPDGTERDIRDGKLRWEREADGRVRRWEWDGDLVVSAYDSDGHDAGLPTSQARAYDADGRLLSLERGPTTYESGAELWTWRGDEVETYTSRGEEGFRGLEWREWDDEGRPLAGVWWSHARNEAEPTEHTDVEVLRDGEGDVIERVETRRDGSLTVWSVWQRGPHGVVEAWVEDDRGQVHSWGTWDWDDAGRMVRADDDGGLREWTWSRSGALLAYVHDGRETTFEGDCRSASRPYRPPDVEPVLVRVPGPILEPLPGLFQGR